MKIFQDQESQEVLLLLNLRLECEKVPSHNRKATIRKNLIFYKDTGMVHYDEKDLDQIVDDCWKKLWGLWNP